MVTGGRGGRADWGLVALLSGTATAAYLCRVNVSVAGALIMEEYGLNQAQMGRVFSAFLLGYTLLMMPGGLLADAWGTTRTLSRLAWGWVALTALHAALPRADRGADVLVVLAGLVALRFLMGAFAAPTYPAAVQGVSRWIDPRAHGRANGFIIGSVGLGSAIAPPFVTAVMIRWGWRAAMVASALPALALAAVWLIVREPADARPAGRPPQPAGGPPEARGAADARSV
ncbi:MAG TPA: MFS transporter, partial [Vicinamibacterales bacterium]|nr:MFS transporter [Vicinamibacterales bacterium]